MPTTDDASTQQLIDRVVREVLARLGPAGGEAPHPAGPAAAFGGSRREGERAPFTFADRVISVDSLAQVPAGVDRVLVEASTVITPAARDLARQRGIAWIRQGVTPVPDREGLLVGDTDSSARATGLTHQLLSRGLSARLGEPDALLREVQQGQALGLVLSDLPAGFVCTACRNPAVRAAAVSELNELHPIAAQLQPNLWVIDMRRVTLSKAIVLAERAIRMFPQGATS